MSALKNGVWALLSCRLIICARYKADRGRAAPGGRPEDSFYPHFLFFLNVFLYRSSPKDRSCVIFAWNSGPGDPACARRITPLAIPHVFHPGAIIRRRRRTCTYTRKQKAGWSSVFGARELWSSFPAHITHPVTNSPGGDGEARDESCSSSSSSSSARMGFAWTPFTFLHQ